MTFISMQKAREVWELKEEEVFLVRIINCNKGTCRACPHSFYAYAVNGWNKLKTHRYLGVCDKDGFPRAKYKHSFPDLMAQKR